MTTERPQSTRFIFLTLILSVCGVAVASACLGSKPLSPNTVFQAIMGSPEIDPTLHLIVVDFRLPRILTAALAGAALACAGLIMQTLFRNPLADPFVLGVNSGASLGVALVLLVLAPGGMQLVEGLNTSGQTLIVMASTTGAALTLILVLSLSQRIDVMSLLIVGLMISYAVGALVSILMFFSMAERLQSFLNWSFGQFGNVSWSQLNVFAPAILIGLGGASLFMKPLDALLAGERYAESVGTETRRIRFWALLIASLLAGTVTGFCGPIGFLGIIGPHLCRLLFRTSNHRILIPGSILIGAFLSVTADLVAKAPGAEISLPLNAITALIGASVIIAILIKQRNMQRFFR